MSSRDDNRKYVATRIVSAQLKCDPCFNRDDDVLYVSEGDPFSGK